MATGALPFRGDTSGVIHRRDSESSAGRTGAAESETFPRNSKTIINKALEKDRDLRYQHASDMRTDLKRLRRDTDSGRISSSGSATVQRAVCRSCDRLGRGGSAVTAARLEAIRCFGRLRRSPGGRLCGISLLVSLEHSERPCKDYANQPVEQTDERREAYLPTATRWRLSHRSVASRKCS